ncbi:MAG: tyrosine/phenylalanine carboxypeptidase domain-containing protein, partial [Candidatus Gracilibacteria bacterium]
MDLSKGILGMNARNLLYIRPFNSKRAVRMADSKLKTKHFLSARGIPVPKLYGVIRNRDELQKFDFNTLPQSFVIKPNLGYGGEGIIPVVGREGSDFITVSDEKIPFTDIKDHISDIIDGRYSITGSSDVAFFEQMLFCDDRISKFSYGGLPDVRVVVHNLIPVMAMLRLPTEQSKGRANLHQGAMAVGIDIAKGVTTYVVHNNKIIDGPKGLKGFEIPYWDEILLVSSKVQLLTNLGYLAADIAIDKNNGPVLLEINARAGLGVQIANLAPLRKRLERIRGVKVKTPEKGVRIAQDMFGNKIEKDIQHISGKAVIGDKEMIDVIMKDGIFKALASVNPVVKRSVVDAGFAKSIGLIKEGEIVDKVKLKFSMSDVRVQTVALVEDLPGRQYKLVIGKRDLSDFLIDPSRKYRDVSKKISVFAKGESVPSDGGSGINYSLIDNELADIDRQARLVYHLNPLNLESEKAAFLRDKKYNPQFIYPDLKFDPFRLRERLKSITCDDSPLGVIFGVKRDEILRKLSLVEHIGTDAFSYKSVELFGRPDDSILTSAREYLEDRPSKFINDELNIKCEDAVKMFENVLKKYGLVDWKVKVREFMVSDCMAGKENILFVRAGAMFSEYRLKMLVVHEIETHILTAENGNLQPYRIFGRGLAGYLETQEGIAIRNQVMFCEKDMEKNYWPALSVLVISEAFNRSFRGVVEF